MRTTVIGVMGPGNGAREIDRHVAKELGSAIASQGWILLTGGRNTGVMEAASQGAKQAGGLTIGILPTATDEGMSEAVDIAIFTDLGSARNNINVLSSHAIVACGMGAGTASEVALALKAKKPVILLNCDRTTQAFFENLSSDNLWIAETVEEAIAILQNALIKG
ncbi:TIGR00725 family protein [Oscillatoriales cyanobacterium LEGE 11467]|uniref:TIGR00725 family protein n=1 Tax=Zarconia navalis LEGE 11467 TaxID=1828826 RepID=A0A928VW48_9CYAN|nr:TIGR00725 family protein [Zarconia navalis]MBE9041241.1 TIGR00725 family protein [Zarconia navalis LEGE 11467]